MSPTISKPNQPSAKVGDPINAILNQARSTLNQSRQFRDSGPQDAKSRLAQSQSRNPSSSKVDVNLNRKPSQQKVTTSTTAHPELSKQTSTTSQGVSLVDGSNSKLNLLQNKATISRTQLDVQLPPARASNTGITAPQSAPTKQSGANYDYNSIFSVKASKHVGRSDFNIFKVSPHPTAHASVGTSNKTEGEVLGKPPRTPPGPSNQAQGRRTGGFIDPSKSRPKEKDDDDEYSSDSSESDDDDDGTSSSNADSSAHSTTEDDSDTEDDASHVDDSSTITPPTITETSASKSKSLGNPVKASVTPRPMSLKAITLDGDERYGSSSRPGSGNRRKIGIQDLRDKPIVFTSQESHAVLKAMSPEKDGDYDTYSKQFDNPTPKSYTEDFVSEVQSIADDFSKSFARSVAASLGHSSSDVEIPRTENSTEVPTEASDSSGGHSSTRKKSHHNALNSLKIVHEIKGNLKDLEILDIVETFEQEKAETYLEKPKEAPAPVPEEEYPADLIIAVDGNNTTSASSASAGIPGRNSSKTSSKSEKSLAKSLSPASRDLVLLPKSKRVSVAEKPAKITNPPLSKPPKPTDKKVKLPPPPKPPSQIELTLSRASSRKNFQATLSQVKLRDDDYGPGQSRHQEELSPILAKPATEKEERSRKLELLEQKYPYKTPKTKPQTQIHSILEREVYRKELSRLRKEHRREEVELRLINEARAKNFKKVQDVLQKKDKSHYKQPPLAFPAQEESDSASPENWGAPYFKKDGSLAPGYQLQGLPRTPDENSSVQNMENYAATVGSMNVPQLVREVMKSNERMYKMTIKAAKEMGKEYGRNVKVARKFRDMQPLVKE